MLGVIGNKFSIGKETYEPFAAEMHYFRIDKRYWSICFERIKRAGFRIIASAVPWNVHQVDTQTVDFNGFEDPRKDLVVFLELAREFGFKVILRPGPWVAGQLPYGGLPKFIFNDPKVYARNADGAEITLPDDHGVTGGFLPSYLQPNFQFFLKNYFRAFIDTTKNYVHPRGPVFMVELDYETSFGRLLDPASADYNPEVIGDLWPEWLESRYDDIKSLNQLYKTKYKGWSEVEPPRTFTDLDIKDYAAALDWFRFREYMLRTYLESLEDVFKSFTVEPLLFRSLYFRSGELLPAFNLVPDDRQPFLGSNVFPEGSYFDLVNKARFLRGEFGFAFATSFTSGISATDPKRQREIAPVTNNQRRFYYAAAIASGFKGLNHYMFVNRDRWYGAPLNDDGTVTDGYDQVKNFTTALMDMEFEELSEQPQVAVLSNRLYSWLRQTSSKKEFTYLARLVDNTSLGICRDLLRLKIHYELRENRDYESMKQYKVIFAPIAEVMAEKDQEGLVELARAGVVLILVGMMPKFDENMKPCTVLQNHLRVKTTTDYRIGTIEPSPKGASFPAYVYASIRTTDEARARKLATADSKVVGVCSSRYKGNVYVLTFDAASGGHHHNIAFLEAILEGEKIRSAYFCSDPSVDIAFQRKENKGLLSVVVPPPGELAQAFEVGQRELIIQVDTKELGFAGTSFKLTNILEDPETTTPIKTTAKELKAGLAVTVDSPDGIIWLVTKR